MHLTVHLGLGVGAGREPGGGGEVEIPKGPYANAKVLPLAAHSYPSPEGLHICTCFPETTIAEKSATEGQRQPGGRSGREGEQGEKGKARSLRPSYVLRLFFFSRDM